MLVAEGLTVKSLPHTGNLHTQLMLQLQHRGQNIGGEFKATRLLLCSSLVAAGLQVVVCFLYFVRNTAR
jgi:hypothetical protein